MLESIRTESCSAKKRAYNLAHPHIENLKLANEKRDKSKQVETNIKKSLAAKKQWSDPESRKKLLDGINSESVTQRKRQWAIEHKTEIKANLHSKVARAKRSDSLKKFWDDPLNRQFMIVADNSEHSKLLRSQAQKKLPKHIQLGVIVKLAYRLHPELSEHRKEIFSKLSQEQKEKLIDFFSAREQNSKITEPKEYLSFLKMYYETYPDDKKIFTDAMKESRQMLIKNPGLADNL